MNYSKKKKSFTISQKGNLVENYVWEQPSVNFVAYNKFDKPRN